MRLLLMTRFAVAALFAAALLSPRIHGQAAVPPGTGDKFRDTSMVKPPPGAKVAIYDFEDLECPACSHAFPIVHSAAERYKIPLVRHDFPLQMHIWSFDAAVIARYIQDKISPQAAEEYRGAVFTNQTAIASKEDLQAFTQKYFQSHGRAMPFVIDPNGLFTQEVKSDQTLGERIGLIHTPTVFVVTQKGWTHVTDMNYLYSTIDAALAQAGPAPMATRASAAPMKTKR